MPLTTRLPFEAAQPVQLSRRGCHQLPIHERGIGRCQGRALHCDSSGYPRLQNHEYHGRNANGNSESHSKCNGLTKQKGADKNGCKRFKHTQYRRFCWALSLRCCRSCFSCRRSRSYRPLPSIWSIIWSRYTALPLPPYSSTSCRR